MYECAVIAHDKRLVCKSSGESNIRKCLTVSVSKILFSASQEPTPPPPPAFKPFSMTCKEEGCDFVTDTAEDEAHLPLVMKVMIEVRLFPMIMMVMLKTFVRH